MDNHIKKHQYQAFSECGWNIKSTNVCISWIGLFASSDDFPQWVAFIPSNNIISVRDVTVQPPESRSGEILAEALFSFTPQ